MIRTARAIVLFLTATLPPCVAALRLPAQRPLNDDSKRRGCSEPRPVLFGQKTANGHYAAGDTVPHCIAHVEVFADGNVKNVLGDSKSTASASGALGLHFAGSRFDATGMVNVAGTTDTVTTAYGASLLLPTTGQALNAASLDVRSRFLDWSERACADYTYTKLCNTGWRIHLNASTREWATSTKKSAPLAGSTDSIVNIVSAASVPMWGADVGIWYAFFEGSLPGTDSVSRPVSMLLDVGWAHRALRGDINGGGASQQALRQSLLSSMATNFDGLAVGLTLVFNQLRSNLTYYNIGGAVPGLTGGQIVATVEIRAALASGLLKRN